jgi:hypothetical protein
MLAFKTGQLVAEHFGVPQNPLFGTTFGMTGLITKPRGAGSTGHSHLRREMGLARSCWSLRGFSVLSKVVTYICVEYGLDVRIELHTAPIADVALH